MNVLQLTKRLSSLPLLTEVPGVSLRKYRGTADIGPWLELRHQAFARQKLGIATWTAADFEAEFLRKEWWKPERLWLAESMFGQDIQPELIGSVALAMRGGDAAAKPVVHWLMVRRDWRRRGVATLLLRQLELACWEAGYRQIWLETHAAWTAANQFYERQGFTAATPGRE